MDAEIASLEQRLDKASAIKQGMMQQLLTGRMRPVKPEVTVEKPKVARPAERRHNWQFNEAVLISVLVRHFGNEQYPLGRVRYTKLSYLFHRHEDGRAEGYLKKAAGPYNPSTRYGGPEKIALKNGYIRKYKSSERQGFIAGANIDAAEGYFLKWHGSEALNWLKNFRYERNEDLELLTTVDVAVEELRQTGKEVSVENVKETLRGVSEWQRKLNRPVFSDSNLAQAIRHCQNLFGPEIKL